MPQFPTRLAGFAGLAAALLAAGAAATAGPGDQATARVGEPARVALEAEATRALAQDAGAVLILTLDAYEPAPEGFVSAQVEARGPSGEAVRVGSFSIVPSVGFALGDPASGMSFAFPLAPGDLAALGGTPREIVVRLEPIGGAGGAAAMTIGDVEIRPR